MTSLYNTVQFLWFSSWHKKRGTSLHAIIRKNLTAKPKVGQLRFLPLYQPSCFFFVAPAC